MTILITALLNTHMLRKTRRRNVSYQPRPVIKWSHIKYHDDATFYNPLSPSMSILPFRSPTKSLSQVFQLLHPSSTPTNPPLLSLISSMRSMNCKPRPADTWKGTWQCINQAPGLSDSKASTRYPAAGNVAVSRRIGLSVFSREISPDQTVLAA